MARQQYAQRRIDYHIRGQPHRPLSDLYHLLMRGSWVRILAFAVASYVTMIAIFAGMFLLGGDCIEGAEPGSVSDAFWFSVQTFSTIGYGGMLPKTLYAHALVTVESFVGLAGVAMMTALMYSRFSRPRARVGFSDRLAISNRNGTPTLQLRIANERNNRILQCLTQLHVMVEVTSSEGEKLRRFLELEVEQAQTPMFMMSRLLLHPLDERSPLHDLSPETVHERVIFILASVSGTDDAMMQEVYAQRLYGPSSIAFHQKFVDMIEHEKDRITMHFDNLSRLREE